MFVLQMEEEQWREFRYLMGSQRLQRTRAMGCIPKAVSQEARLVPQKGTLLHQGLHQSLTPRKCSEENTMLCYNLLKWEQRKERLLRRKPCKQKPRLPFKILVPLQRKSSSSQTEKRSLIQVKRQKTNRSIATIGLHPVSVKLLQIPAAWLGQRACQAGALAASAAPTQIWPPASLCKQRQRPITSHVR